MHYPYPSGKAEHIHQFFTGQYNGVTFHQKAIKPYHGPEAWTHVWAAIVEERPDRIVIHMAFYRLDAAKRDIVYAFTSEEYAPPFYDIAMTWIDDLNNGTRAPSPTAIAWRNQVKAYQSQKAFIAQAKQKGYRLAITDEGQPAQAHWNPFESAWIVTKPNELAKHPNGYLIPERLA